MPTKTLWCENGMRLADDLRDTAGVGRAWWYKGGRDLIIVIDPVHELPASRVTLSQALQRLTVNRPQLPIKSSRLFLQDLCIIITGSLMYKSELQKFHITGRKGKLSPDDEQRIIICHQTRSLQVHCIDKVVWINRWLSSTSQISSGPILSFMMSD